MTLQFPTHARPLTSVIVVTRGGWDLPRRALLALRENSEGPYEVIVVDNASPGETRAGLRAEVRGARLIFNDQNVGFGPAANQAALLARGAYLCFMNPDALVQPGWLRPLIEAIERPGVGAVVPRYLNPDGTLQEAGSLIDSEGRTLALGDGAHPEDPRYMFPRTIDYGSAACLLVRRSVFNAVGGFDPSYLPAYFEDVDFAFSLRARGLRVVYEPRAVVVHVGAGSSDDATRGELIERNRPLFLERWGEELAGRPRLDDLDLHPHRLVALRDALAAVRLLLVAYRVEEDSQVGLLAAEMAAGWPEARVTLLSPLVVHPEPLLEAGVEVVDGPEIGLSAWLEERRFHYTGVIAWGPVAASLIREPLQRTQPGALFGYALNDVDQVADTSATEWRLAEVEAVRAAHAVFCPPGREDAARALAPEAEVFALVSRRADRAALASGMAFLGLAPSNPPV